MRLISLAVAAASMLIIASAFPVVAAEGGEDFTDVPSDHVFFEAVNWMADQGVTKGCNPPDNDRYCPDSPVTRGQMAAFLSRAFSLKETGPVFKDAEDSVFASDVSRLAFAGVTRGCNPPVNDLFCPDSPVTRGQMAAFLRRALSLPAGSSGFSDASGSVFEADIAALADAGITRGCNPPVNDLFCPDALVTRGQMAAFLYRALGVDVPVLAEVVLDSGAVGVPWEATIPVSGGAPPFEFTASGMPPGVAIESDTPSLAGVPTTVGAYSIEVTVVDRYSRTATRTYDLEILSAPPSIDTSSLPNATEGVLYNVELSASAEEPCCVWGASGLPAGLSLSPAGVLAGTATEAGSFDVEVTATADDGRSATRSLTLVVEEFVVAGCEGNETIPNAECTALVALYDSTNGDNWDDSTDWLSGDPCTWSGVQCDAGHVQMLSLRGNELSGPIPAELGELSGLQGLLLTGNQLSGSIPSALGDLSSLRWLALDYNSLSGSIPSELGQLGNLEVLALQVNQLTGSIPAELGQLTGLVELHLFDNQLSGSIPPELGQLSILNRLSLENNDLSGSIPAELGQLTALWSLGLTGNDLSGSIPAELSQMTSLQILALDVNALSGSIPAELGQLSNLIVLRLNDNLLSGSIPAELGQLSSLGSLYLYSNDLSGSIPAELGQLGNLGRLHLYFNDLSGSIPAELGQLADLEELSLYSNDLSGSIPAELGQLTNLQEMFLNWNSLSGSIPAELGQLSNLETLYLHSNDLSGAIPAELGQLASLRELQLDSNQLSGSVPAELGQLSNLELLSAYNNQLSGSLPAELGQLSNLVEMFFTVNQLSGSIPAEFGQLASLEKLVLATNQLSGVVPDAIRDLTSLTYLRLGGSGCLTASPETAVWLDARDPNWDSGCG